MQHFATIKNNSLVSSSDIATLSTGCVDTRDASIKFVFHSSQETTAPPELIPEEKGEYL